MSATASSPLPTQPVDVAVSVPLEDRLAAAHRRCHELWSNEPPVSPDERTELVEALSDADAELASFAVALSVDDVPSRRFVQRLDRVEDALDELEERWFPDAA